MNNFDRTRVIDVVASVSTVAAAEIKDDDRLREDLGMDSISSMELLSALSEEFDLDIEMEEAIEITTVRALLALAEKRLGHA